jgi:hypothetical protein
VTKRIWISSLLVWSAARAIAAEEPAREVTPLRIELKLSAAPDGTEGAPASMALYVLADSDKPTVLRAGREVAVPAADDRYRNVGTNVTCRASASGDGFRLDLDIELSSLVEGSDPGRPSFHTFSVHSSVRLLDGESARILAGVGGSVPGSPREVEAKLVVLRD